MSTMTGPVAPPKTELVGCIMKELRELAGEKAAVESEKIESAIVNVLTVDRRILPQNFTPGMKAFLKDCRAHPGRIQELKYVERELYGTFARPVTP